MSPNARTVPSSSTSTVLFLPAAAWMHFLEPSGHKDDRDLYDRLVKLSVAPLMGEAQPSVL